MDDSVIDADSASQRSRRAGLKFVAAHPVWVALAVIYLLVVFVAVLFSALIVLTALAGVLGSGSMNCGVSVEEFSPLVCAVVVTALLFVCSVAWHARRKTQARKVIVGCCLAGFSVSYVLLVVAVLCSFVSNIILWGLSVAALLFSPGVLMLKEAIEDGDLKEVKNTITFLLTVVSFCCAIDIPLFQIYLENIT